MHEVIDLVSGRNSNRDGRSSVGTDGGDSRLRADSPVRTGEPRDDALLVYSEYHQRVRAYIAGRLQNHHDTSDLVQEVFSRHLSYRGQIDNTGAFLFTIASNLIRDRARKYKYQESNRSQLEYEQSMTAQDNDPEKATEARQQLAKVREALLELHPNCRRAFLLHRFEAYSYRQIAELMGVSVKMVEKHISDALRQCRLRTR